MSDFSSPNFTVGKAEYRRQAITARTVNDELRIVGAHVAKARRRLEAKPDCPARQAVLAHHMGTLEAVIASAHAGRTYRQR
jgi:hypothetical protein